MNNDIFLPAPKESGHNVEFILSHIADDINRWHEVTGVDPGRICLTNILYEAIAHWSGVARCYDTKELMGEPMLFGIPISRYEPAPKDGPMAVGYYLATPERKFAFKED